MREAFWRGLFVERNKMEMTSETKLLPLLGKPLAQSLSSKVTNEIYRLEGIDCLKFPVEVDATHLKDVVTAFRYMNIMGMTVTKPNKIEVMKYLDEIDDLAEKIGAVNVITMKGGKLKGYNTDGEACVRSLVRETGCDVAKATFFCFGAGGAGRAICTTLAHYGAKRIFIMDKLDEQGDFLARRINELFAPIAEHVAWTDKAGMAQRISQADVVLNTSGIGMYPHLDETPVEKSLLAARQIVFDATYNPPKTKLLREAESIGCRIVNGQGMLVYAGAIGHEILTGRPAPIEKWMALMAAAMKEAALPPGK
jgi:shikimate dehydrogenase